MNKKLVWSALVIIIAVGLFYFVKQSRQPGPLDEFAKCLTEKKAVFYGAFWCPHCQKQKKLFGRSFKYIKYVECSTPDGRGQLPRCDDKKVEGYPTWEFADASRETGEVSLDKLARKSDCVLPK